MKILIAIAAVFIISCSQSSTSPAAISAPGDILTANTWVVDSVYSIKAGVTTKTYVSAPTYLKYKFSNTGSYNITSSYDVPATKKYELDGSKIFYWETSAAKDASQYFTILKLENNFFSHSQTKGSGEITQYFSHAE